MTPLDRLFEAARRANPHGGDADAPYGFATRVVTAWRTAPPVSPWAPLAPLTLRALGFAAILLLSAVAFHAMPGGELADLDPDIANAMPLTLFLP